MWIIYDMNIIEELITNNKGLVYYIVNKYYHKYANDDDVIQCGMIGLWKAAKSYQPEKSKFATYASKCILSEIGQYFRKENKHSHNVSLNCPIDTDEDGNELSLQDTLVSTELSFLIDTDYLQNVLDDREIEAILLCYNGYTQKEIAKVLNVCQPQVSRILSKVKYKIQQSVTEREV